MNVTLDSWARLVGHTHDHSIYTRCRHVRDRRPGILFAPILEWLDLGIVFVGELPPEKLSRVFTKNNEREAD